MKSTPHSFPAATEMSRRAFLGLSVAVPLVALPNVARPAPSPRRSGANSLAGEIGLTTGTFMHHLRADPKFHQSFLLDLPQQMRERLDLRVIDLMSLTFASFDNGYVDRLRANAERHGCIYTNLKINQEANMASEDPAERKKAMTLYHQMIDVAHRLGCRWVRPALSGKLNRKFLVEGYRHLIEYGAPKGISLIVEMLPGMREDPEAVPRLIAEVGPGIAACPDLVGWSDKFLFEGLKKAFPLAVTCDFKARPFGPKWEHPEYDLRRCFYTGIEAGFRGPWVMEYFNDTPEGVWRGLIHLAGLLRTWVKETSGR